MKLPQRPRVDQWRTEDEGGTRGAEHPRRQRAGRAAFQPDEDDLAIWKFLASVDRQALSVEGVPTVVDRYDFKFRKMMGIM